MKEEKLILKKTLKFDLFLKLIKIIQKLEEISNDKITLNVTISPLVDNLF